MRTPSLAAAGSDHFATIVESSDDAILSKDRDGIILSWNPAAQRIYGYSEEEALGQHISMLMPEHRKGEEDRILDQVFSGARVDHYETERVTKDGRRVTVSLSVSPVRDETDTIVRASVIARDITSRERSRELASRLQDVTAALSQEITPARTIAVLLEQVTAAFGAAAAAVGLLDEAGTEIELAGASGYTERGVADWRRFPLDADVPMAASIRSGEAIWTNSAEELRTRFPDLASSKVIYAALAILPLSVGGEPFGALSVSFSEPKTFDPEERAFLSAVAGQAAHAMERARLYESGRSTGERLAFLAEASELLSESLDPEETMQQFAHLAVRRIADWCSVEMVEAGGNLRNVAVAHIDPAQIKFASDLRARYPIDPDQPTGAPNVIRTGKSELYPEIPEELLIDSAVDGEHLELMRGLGLESVMIVPLIARSRVLGAVTYVAAEEGRHYGPEDLELAENLAHRAALAIDNSMLFRREHEAALTLQRSLLPRSLPEMEGIEFAAHYDPGAAGREVGGDWYEAVAQPDGTVAVTIGDVAGHGVAAAAIMGRARTALRAYVLEGHRPAAAVKRMDRLLREADRREMVTLTHLHFDPATGLAEYVRAGHPPTLLRLPDGSVEELAGAGTPPLGILDEISYRVHAVAIPPGSLLLLYTDGLIERRGENLGDALERLKKTLARAPAGAADCLEFLRAEFRADEAPDDVAMLAMASSAPG